MNVRRNEVCSWLTNSAKNILNSRDEIRKIAGKLEEKFNIPESKSIDLLVLRNDFEDEEDVILYCFTWVFDHKQLEKFFSSIEIKRYQDYHYEIPKVKLPLRFKMIEVASNQWIGTIDLQMLMKLANAQMIYYNERTQRRMKHVRNGETEYYTIDLNRQSVDSIMELMDQGKYIADPITFNIPIDDNNWCEYDYDSMELVIYSLDHFDILDGYHRYIALSTLYRTHKRFKFTMEFRIVSFTESDAQQFIWQQDQKTKLKKIDSESLNQSKLSNMIAQRLNGENEFCLKGYVLRNQGIIDYSYLAKVVESAFLRGNISKKQQIIRVNQITRDIKDAINSLAMEDDTILQKKWDYKYTLAVIYCASFGVCTKAHVNHLYEILCNSEDFKHLVPSKPLSGVDHSRIVKEVDNV